MCLIGADEGGHRVEIHFHDLTVYCVMLKDGKFSFPGSAVGGEPGSARRLKREERGIRSVVGSSVEVF